MQGRRAIRQGGKACASAGEDRVAVRIDVWSLESTRKHDLRFARPGEPGSFFWWVNSVGQFFAPPRRRHCYG